MFNKTSSKRSIFRWMGQKRRKKKMHSASACAPTFLRSFVKFSLFLYIYVHVCLHVGHTFQMAKYCASIYHRVHKIFYHIQTGSEKDIHTRTSHTHITLCVQNRHSSNNAWFMLAYMCSSVSLLYLTKPK